MQCKHNIVHHRWAGRQWAEGFSDFERWAGRQWAEGFSDFRQWAGRQWAEGFIDDISDGQGKDGWYL